MNALTGILPATLQDGLTAYFSILLEALPFLLLGSLLASLLETGPGERIFKKLLPQNRYLAYLYALVAGLVFPVCDCASLPVAARMVKKGLPSGAAVVFLMASPFINPVSLGASWLAFSAQPQNRLMYFCIRLGLGLGLAMLAGIIMSFYRGNPLRVTQHQQIHSGQTLRRPRGKIPGHFTRHLTHVHTKPKPVVCACGHEHSGYFAHASADFLNSGIYLALGAMVAVIIPMFISPDALQGLNRTPAAAILFMQFLSYVLSLCSNSDTFVAAGFAFTFSPVAVLAFMLTGPFLDIKNTFVLFSLFKHRFAMRLVITGWLLIFITCVLLGWWYAPLR